MNRKNSNNSSTEDFYCKKPDLLDEHDADTKAHENLDVRFLDELCNARESTTDDWDKVL